MRQQETLQKEDAPWPAGLFAFIDKEVFMLFNKDQALSTAERTTQLGFIQHLSQLAFKNNITKGLGDGNVLLHYYLTELSGKI